MGDELFSTLEELGVICLLLVGIGFFSGWFAVARVQDEFRVKGYLQVPMGWEFFHFLRRKHYESFKDPAARFFFALCWWCMVGLLLAAGVAVCLVGSTLLLKGVP